MCANLSHRGPDDEGVYCSSGTPSVNLGHRRLSIIDLSGAGRQPMSNEDGTVRLVLNGEIYNFHELREELILQGHRFRSNSDTETVVHLYEQLGTECVRKLRGMFAFALWDSRKGILMLARDRVGKKPLLFQHRGNTLCFASEFAALLESGLIDREINFSMFDYYLAFGYIPSPFTIYKDVYKLQPGHTMVLKDNRIRIDPYWDLAYSDKLPISFEDARRETLRLLEDAVKKRLYSDVPLGAFLSGGIDSSTVVALMARCSGSRINTFSIGFEDEDYSELKFARNIARQYDTCHHELIVRPNALEVLPQLVERYGEPYADSSAIPTYYVSRETKRSVTVALNGDGGDEAFGGYERYQAMLLAERLNGLPPAAKSVIRRCAGLLPDSVEPKNRIRRMRRFFDSALLPDFERYAKWIGIFDGAARQEIYSREFLRMSGRQDCSGFYKKYFSRGGAPHVLDSVQNADVHTYLPEDLLVKVDIASMANSLECRSPFLDHTVMEFAARLPASYRIRKGARKFVLTEAIRGIVPAANIYRRKMGFGVPVGRWFRGELRGYISETLLGDRSIRRGYFNPEAMRRLVLDHTEGRADHSFKLWALLMLELWHRRFIDR